MSRSFAGSTLRVSPRPLAPPPRILALAGLHAGQDASQVIQEALEAGPVSLVISSGDPSTLEHGLRATAAGNRFFCARAGTYLQDLVTRVRGDRKPPLSASREAASRLAALTRRERQVASLVAAGLPTREVAATLSLGDRTVELHRFHARTKSGSRNTADLVRLVVLAGCLPQDPVKA